MKKWMVVYLTAIVVLTLATLLPAHQARKQDPAPAGAQAGPLDVPVQASTPATASKSLRAAVQTQEQEEQPEPMTKDELGFIVTEASTTASAIEVIQVQIADVNNRGKALVERMKIHDAQYPPGGCTYPEGHPEVCQPWVQAGRDLNTEMKSLISEYNADVGQKGMLKTHFGVLMARLRIAPFLGDLEDWKDSVVFCANRPNEMTAANCLKGVWEHHP
jgi:hypothetical protein